MWLRWFRSVSQPTTEYAVAPALCLMNLVAARSSRCAWALIRAHQAVHAVSNSLKEP